MRSSNIYVLLLAVSFIANITANCQTKKPCFLVISDTHIDTTLAITTYGSETGKDLWAATLPKLKQVIASEKPSFIILLGDLPWHAKRDSLPQLESAKANTGIVLHDLRELAEAEKIPLLYTPGNNDSQDGDYASFTATNKKTPFFLDKGHEQDWPMIANRKAAIADSSIVGLGSYSAWPLGKKSKLRVIVLNTVIFTKSKKNQYSLEPGKQQADAAATMAWFEKELAASAGEAVLVAMHVPPGQDSYNNSGNNFWSPTLTYGTNTILDTFLNLVDTYKANIIGLLSSHTHMDAIKLLTNRSNQYTNFILSIPAITPDHQNNPAIKLVNYNPDNFTLTNFTTLYNPIKNNGITAWDSSYTFNNEFHCPAGLTLPYYVKTEYAKDTSLKVFKQYVQNIYMVKSPQPNVNNMTMAVRVRYQK